MADNDKIIEEVVAGDYKYGFTTNIEQEFAAKGLSEDTVRCISAKKEEPEWMLEWRLKAYRAWLKMEQPIWQNVHFPDIDFQSIIYYAAQKKKKKIDSLDDVDPEIRATYDKLGIPIQEQKILAGVAVDYVMDSESVITTFRESLKEKGIIFCSISEAVREHPELVKQYLGSVVPQRDNFYAALNSAVFS